MSLWTAAKYPGDTVRILMLKRGQGRAMELGSINIQDFGQTVRVGTFLPGEEECSLGDTPKTWPEKHENFRADNQSLLADAAFDRFVGEAYEAGWQNYNREVDGYG